MATKMAYPKQNISTWNFTYCCGDFSHGRQRLDILYSH